jgi:uncharacterized SAM-binding protein YcdF (DUF218 family)
MRRTEPCSTVRIASVTATAPLVLDDAEHVDRLGAELIANRLRARPGLRLLHAGPTELFAAIHDPQDSRPGRPDEPPLELAVLRLDATDRPLPLRALWSARAVIVLATGTAIGPALHAMLEQPPSPASPASLLRGHPRLSVITDRAAAAALQPAPAWDSDRALVVLGHREPGISPEHRISDESRARLRHAADIARDEPVRAAVLTGWTRSGGLSEAEQMLTSWDDADTPALLEVAGRDTAENATRSLPLLLATGVIRRVTVVSSAWHVRTRWFFAPYRRYGLRVDFSSVVTPVSRWGPLVANEVRLIPAAPRRRRKAYAMVEPGWTAGATAR